jgi:hypothetical protein
MASNINTTDIDAEYPVAGQDNDSQGFRDNFSTIKENFIQAKTEIEALQDTTAKVDGDNDFNGNVIRDASLESVTEEVNVIAGVNSQIDINFTNGHYQSVQVVADVTLRFALWPDELKVGKIRLLVRGDGTERTINWTTEAGGTIKYDPNFPAPFTVTSITDPTVVDFWTDDGGQVVYAEYIGQFTS